MAKINIFSEVVLGITSAITISLASAISPAHACGDGITGYDADGNPVYTNCTETTTETLKDCMKKGYSSTECEKMLKDCAEDGLDATDCEDIQTIPALKELLEDEDEDEEPYSLSGTELSTQHTVNHSFFLAGNQIASSDSVEGLSAIAGNLVEFSGSSEYSAIAGNSVKISGYIEKDLFVAGSAVELTEDASVGRDVFGFAGSFIIKSNLHGNIFVGGNRLVLENVTIDGDFKADFEEIVIKGKSSIAGKFEYNDNAVITGIDNLTTGKTVVYEGASQKDSGFSLSITEKLIFLAGRLLVTIVFIGVASKFTKRLMNEFNLKSSWKYLAFGLGLLLVVPLASIFVLITVIGLPLGLIGLAFYFIFAYFSSSVTGLIVGDKLAKKLFKKEKMHVFLKVTIGLCVLTLLGLIPYIGGLITAVSTCFGFGYLVHKIFRQPKTAK